MSDLSEPEDVLTVSIQTQTPPVKSVDKAVGSINELKQQSLVPNRPEENKKAETQAETNLFKIISDSAKFSSKLEEINEKVATYEKSLIQMKQQEVPGTIR